MSAPDFVYPTDLHFTCSRCGDCCRGWNVMLGPGEPERLAALLWNGLEPDLVDAAPGAPAPGDSARGRLALSRRPDGACIYLGPENQCRIHERFGADAKPLMCRLYPFGFFPVQERIAVDVSFACRAVSENRGEPLSRRVPEWSRLLHERPSAEDRHRFSAKYDVSGDLLWEVEHQVLELLSEETLPLLDRLRAVLEFNRLATTSDPRTEAARTLRQVMAKGIPHQIRERALGSAGPQLDKTGRAVFFHFLFLALNPTPVELLSRKGKAREREVRLRLQAADGYRFPEARPLIDNRGSEADFAGVAAVDAGALAEAEGARVAASYLRAKILGQRFMREGEEAIPFVEAIPRLLLTVPMAVWTAKAFAAERGASAAAASDLRRALRLVDRSFGEVRLSLLPPKPRKAWRFVILETDLPISATLEMLRPYNAAGSP